MSSDIEREAEYSQGIIAGEGAAVLKNGVPLTVDDLVAELNGLQGARAQAGSGEAVPEVANEDMLSEGVEALIRGMKAFPGNYTQIVSNIWEDMAAQAPTTTQPTATGAGVEWDDEAVDPIVSKLYRKFKEWSRRGFTADDVTWCEVRGYVAELLNTTQPTGGEWVSVKDKQPPVLEQCLGWNARANMINKANTYRLFTAAVENTCDISHWMPLPQPPQDREGGEA